MAADGFLRLCNRLIDLVVMLGLLLLGSFGAYALWDNTQVIAGAEEIRAELIQLKPETAPGEEAVPGADFSRLRQINPDVRGWIAMEGTGIDFPVLQGQNNMSYISRDVYGNFSLAGSIFLDSRNDPAFADGYSLLYGHHMADGNMFGDLQKYKEAAFFREKTGGQLILPEKTYDLEVAACLVVSASDRRIFDPETVEPTSLRALCRSQGLHIREEILKEDGKFLALSTCSEEYADARTVVLARMVEREEGRTE